MTALTDLTVLTSRITGSTMKTIGLKVVASSLALRLPRWAGDGACTVRTYFARLAFGSTSTAVFTVVGCIDAHPVAVGLSFGACCFHTLPLVTVVLRRAVFDFGAKLKAATCIFHTNLVLTGDLSRLCRALKRSILALTFGAIRNTGVLFTLLEVFANSPTFAFPPHTTTAFLGSFHTSFAIGG